MIEGYTTDSDNLKRREEGLKRTLGERINDLWRLLREKGVTKEDYLKNIIKEDDYLNANQP